MRGKRIFGAALALCLTLAWTLPAHAAQTVGGSMWSDGFIYVDEIPVYFINEQGEEAYAIVYNGSVYIPLQSAGEWLGGTSAWDAASQTVTLTRGENPTYYSINDGLPELPTSEQWAQIEQYRKDVENGIDLTPLPEATVLLDGEAVAFADARGSVLCPLLFREMIYLPIRGLGELCGKQVLWFTAPNPPATEEWPERLEGLHPHMPAAADRPSIPYVLLYDALTPEEEEDARAYLERAEGLYEEILSRALTIQNARESLSLQQTRMVLEGLQAAAAGLCALESPHPVLQELVCRNVDYRGQLIGAYIAQNLPAFLGEEGSGAPPSTEGFARSMVSELYELRRIIDLGWDLLEAVQAQAAPQGGETENG